MLSRRSWIRGVSAVGLAPALAWAAGGASAGPRAAAAATASVGLPIGERFRLLDPVTASPWLILAGLLEGPTSPLVDQFGLVFVGTADLELPAATYELQHAGLRRLQLYLEPMEPLAEARAYVAEFGQLRSGPGYVRDFSQLWNGLRTA